MVSDGGDDPVVDGGAVLLQRMDASLVAHAANAALSVDAETVQRQLLDATQSLERLRALVASVAAVERLRGASIEARAVGLNAVERIATMLDQSVENLFVGRERRAVLNGNGEVHPSRSTGHEELVEARGGDSVGVQVDTSEENALPPSHSEGTVDASPVPPPRSVSVEAATRETSAEASPRDEAATPSVSTNAGPSQVTRPTARGLMSRALVMATQCVTLCERELSIMDGRPNLKVVDAVAIHVASLLYAFKNERSNDLRLDDLELLEEILCALDLFTKIIARTNAPCIVVVRSTIRVRSALLKASLPKLVRFYRRQYKPTVSAHLISKILPCLDPTPAAEEKQQELSPRAILSEIGGPGPFTKLPLAYLTLDVVVQITIRCSPSAQVAELLHQLVEIEAQSAVTNWDWSLQRRHWDFVTSQMDLLRASLEVGTTPKDVRPIETYDLNKGFEIVNARLEWFHDQCRKHTSSKEKGIHSKRPRIE